MQPFLNIQGVLIHECDLGALLDSCIIASLSPFYIKYDLAARCGRPVAAVYSGRSRRRRLRGRAAGDAAHLARGAHQDPAAGPLFLNAFHVFFLDVLRFNV